MKIIVNNEHEKKLLLEFMSLLWEWGLETLEDDDHDSSFAGIEGYRILKDDMFLNGTNIEIDDKEPEMAFDETNFVCGFCITCGAYWEGFEEGYELTYRGLREFDAVNQKCEDCYFGVEKTYVFRLDVEDEARDVATDIVEDYDFNNCEAEATEYFDEVEADSVGEGGYSDEGQ